MDPPSALASDHPEEGDYPSYDVIQYVTITRSLDDANSDSISQSWIDRDMFMRYCGGGPGHAGIPICSIAWKIAPPPPVDAPPIVPDVPQQTQEESSSDDDGDESDFMPDPDELELLGRGLVQANIDYGL